MKNFLRRAILAVVCASLLLFNSINIYAATIDRIEDYGSQKYIYYNTNDLLIVNSGSTQHLANNENYGNWYFTSGRSCGFNLSMIMKADFNVKLYKNGYGLVYSYTFIDCSYVGTSYDWLIDQYGSGNYMILIEPINSTCVIADMYTVWY